MPSLNIGKISSLALRVLPCFAQASLLMTNLGIAKRNHLVLTLSTGLGLLVSPLGSDASLEFVEDRLPIELWLLRHPMGCGNSLFGHHEGGIWRWRRRQSWLLEVTILVTWPEARARGLDRAVRCGSMAA